MNEHFLTYEQCLTIKELGFDEPCFGYYTHNEKLCRYGADETNVEFLFCTHKDIYKTYSLAPLKSQFFRWVREKYEHCVHITPHTENDGDDNFIIYQYEWEIIHPKYFDGTYHDTYEQAEDACINKIIELLKTK